MSQTVQAQSLLPYIFQSPPDVLQLSANTSWECATPGAGALVDSLRIRHSYNRRGQCTFHFLSYTNYTKLKKKSLCVRVCLHACVYVYLDIDAHGGPTGHQIPWRGWDHGVFSSCSLSLWFLARKWVVWPQGAIMMCHLKTNQAKGPRTKTSKLRTTAHLLFWWADSLECVT